MSICFDDKASFPQKHDRARNENWKSKRPGPRLVWVTESRFLRLILVAIVVGGCRCRLLLMLVDCDCALCS